MSNKTKIFIHCFEKITPFNNRKLEVDFTWIKKNMGFCKKS